MELAAAIHLKISPKVDSRLIMSGMTNRRNNCLTVKTTNVLENRLEGSRTLTESQRIQEHVDVKLKERAEHEGREL
jgi:hypothetical protein